MEAETNKSLAKEFWDYVRIRKKLWLLPVIILLLLVGILFAISAIGGGTLSPFIYALG